MELPRKALERKLFKKGYRYIYAVDEVGIGSLAGPVVTCAVGMTNTFYKRVARNLNGLRDSKLLSPKQRGFFAGELLRRRDLVYSVTYSHPKKIDQVNIYNAARLAMKRALKKIEPAINLKSIVLVDGKTKIGGVDLEQMPIVKGDRKVFAIACASIIAKVYRDKMMTKYAKRYPKYGFDIHKGYGTKFHYSQLVSLGPCEIHRKSFAPVAKLI